MICRIWHGWTSHDDADAFENVLKSEVIAPLHAKGVAGFHGVQTLRLALLGQTEFINMAWFDDMDAVRQLAGEQYEQPILTENARALLRRSDRTTQHNEVRDNTLPH